MAKEKSGSSKASDHVGSSTASAGVADPQPGTASEDAALREMVAADEAAKAASRAEHEALEARERDEKVARETAEREAREAAEAEQRAKEAEERAAREAEEARQHGANLDKFAALGAPADGDQPEKSEAEIAQALQDSMAARLTGTGADAALLGAEEQVLVTVPKAFFLRLRNQQVVAIKAGTQKLPRSQAEHQYSKDNGVKVFDPDARDITAGDYDKAAADVISGENTLDYTVTGMASYFKADAATVRAELTKRVDKLKGGGT